MSTEEVVLSGSFDISTTSFGLEVAYKLVAGEGSAGRQEEILISCRRGREGK